ncbi:MAG: hypothetical protein R3B07_11075 [Polyangiaceae bacterium]
MRSWGYSMVVTPARTPLRSWIRTEAPGLVQALMPLASCSSWMKRCSALRLSPVSGLVRSTGVDSVPKPFFVLFHSRWPSGS